jgi:hypothetical protein
MFLSVSYCEGYGWHCGRLLLWAALLFIGIPAAFIAVFVEEIVMVVAVHFVPHLSSVFAIMRFPIPLALCVPLVFAFLLRRRLKRKLNGEPFAISLPAFFMDDTSVLLISRGHRHFWALGHS